MKFKVLGTQSPYATQEHNCPGYLIEHKGNKILIDLGSGSHRLLNMPQDLENMYAFFSHLHRDHYNDVFNLQYSSFVFHNQKRLQKPIKIYLPQIQSNIAKDIISESNAYAEYEEIQEDKKIKIGDINISFCRTDHPIETYAMKIENNEKTIVYTADTSFSAKERLVNFAKEADLLISEASLLKEHGFPEINSHLTAAQAARIAKEANAKNLMLTHFWPEEDVNKYVQEAKTIFKNTIAAREGLEFLIETEKVMNEPNERN